LAYNPTPEQAEKLKNDPKRRGSALNEEESFQRKLQIAINKKMKEKKEEARHRRILKEKAKLEREKLKREAKKLKKKLKKAGKA